MKQKKGTGKSGGGLKARIKAYETEKLDRGYRKPGSQNPRKGGTGK